MTNDAANPRPRFPWLYALPAGVLPAVVFCNGVRYELVRTFKHDFFAATGLYRDPAGGLAVLKLGRRGDVWSFPTDWIGEFLTDREVRHYELLQGLAGVPRLIGRVGRAGLLHDFVPGAPLDKHSTVSDTFFAELDALVGEIHRRGMAYVDLNKPQNVLLGEDGRPYLIDFQISLHWPAVGWRRWGPVRWLLGRFQHGDLYHCAKHKRRIRPEQMTARDKELVERVGFWIRLHRTLSGPLRNARRKALKKLKAAETMDVVGSSAK